MNCEIMQYSARKVLARERERELPRALGSREEFSLL